MESQTAQIIKALESGKELTALDALNEFGCLRLAARINDIRNSGYDVISRTIKTNGKRYSGYKLG